MRTIDNEDGTTSYIVTENEKFFMYTIVAYILGRRVGYTRGRNALAKEIKKTGTPQP